MLAFEKFMISEEPPSAEMGGAKKIMFNIDWVSL